MSEQSHRVIDYAIDTPGDRRRRRLIRWLVVVGVSIVMSAIFYNAMFGVF